MPGPGGPGINNLLDMMQAQPGVNPVDGGGNFGTFGLNQWSPGASAPPYFGGGGNAPGIGGQAASMPDDLAQYFGAFGQAKIDDPRKVAGDAGISLGDLAGGFLPRGGVNGGQAYSYPSDRGGFFRAEDLFGLQGTPTAVQNMGPQRAGGAGANMHVERVGDRGVPSIATAGMDQPSTNNWRLLGMGPGWIMRNGQLINTQSADVPRGMFEGADLGAGLTAEHGPGALFQVGLGTGAPYGQPGLFARGGPGMAGWPGASTWSRVFGGNV